MLTLKKNSPSTALCAPEAGKAIKLRIKRAARSAAGGGKSAPGDSRAASEESPGEPASGLSPELPPPPRRRAAIPATAVPTSTLPTLGVLRPTPARKTIVPFARKPIFEQLEPRLLLSADLNPLAQDALFASPSLQPAART